MGGYCNGFCASLYLLSSIWQALRAEQSCSAERKQLKSTLEKQEEELRQVQSKHLHTHHDLEKTRDLCVKLDTGKEAVCSVTVRTLTLGRISQN